MKSLDIMRPAKSLLLLILTSALILPVSRCGKSFWEQGNENVVRTLVDSPVEAGEFIIFWDGKDKDKKTLPPGKYWCLFRSLEYEKEIEMTGRDGGKGVPADSSGYIPSAPLHFLLEQNHPNPFFMKNGTNIPFTVPYSVHVQLTIRNKE